MVITPKFPANASWNETVSGRIPIKPFESDSAITHKLLSRQIEAQTDRSEFIEDCIAEMAMQVYGDG